MTIEPLLTLEEAAHILKLKDTRTGVKLVPKVTELSLVFIALS